MNTIRVIAPYLYHGVWVFDDPDAGLLREAFVAGADEVLDRAVARFPRRHRDRCIVKFSDHPFPEATLELRWRRPGLYDRGRWKGRLDGGNWYYSVEFGHELWLCGALLKYFSRPPRRIYATVQMDKGRRHGVTGNARKDIASHRAATEAGWLRTGSRWWPKPLA